MLSAVTVEWVSTGGMEAIREGSKAKYWKGLGATEKEWYQGNVLISEQGGLSKKRADKKVAEVTVKRWRGQGFV